MVMMNKGRGKSALPWVLFSQWNDPKWGQCLKMTHTVYGWLQTVRSDHIERPSPCLNAPDIPVGHAVRRLNVLRPSASAYALPLVYPSPREYMIYPRVLYSHSITMKVLIVETLLGRLLQRNEKNGTEQYAATSMCWAT